MLEQLIKLNITHKSGVLASDIDDHCYKSKILIEKIMKDVMVILDRLPSDLWESNTVMYKRTTLIIITKFRMTDVMFMVVYPLLNVISGIQIKGF